MDRGIPAPLTSRQSCLFLSEGSDVRRAAYNHARLDDLKHRTSTHFHSASTPTPILNIHFSIMFIKSSLITLALVMSASATPLVGGVGTAVAIQKRNTLTKDDGSFDHTGALEQVVRDSK